MGEIARRRGSAAAEAASAYGAASAVARARGMRPLELHCLAGQAELAQSAGDTARATTLSGEARALAAQLGFADPFHPPARP
ncbi:MAG: hypothetical protein FJX68_13180 [Alphaproteobacteria bacterium]|nr:hypothetical protein [Alphaproteobacteria bacterium]